MSLSQIEKVLIAFHHDEKKKFLSRLQDEGILHITEIKEKESEESEENIELDISVASLDRVIKYLRPYRKESLIDSLFGNKTIVSEGFYRDTLSSNRYKEMVTEVKNLEKKKTELQREKIHLETQLEELLPWKSLDFKLEDLRDIKKITVEIGSIPKPPHDFEDKVTLIPAEVEIIGKDKERTYCIFAYRPEARDEVRNFLTTISFEPARLEGLEGLPSDVIERLKSNIKAVEKDLEEIEDRSSKIAEDLERIFIIYEEDYNASLRDRALSNAFLTSRAVLIEGWVRKRDKKKLERLADEFSTLTIEEIKPNKDEKPPVELENRKPFRPFEILTKLYGTPHPTEIDPSPIIAPFFILFFALCLSDAMYGLVFAIISLFLMRKITGDKRLLKVLIAGSLATIIVGALLGGWFGDLPQRLSAVLPGFAKFREKLILFDPMNQPLYFFILSLGIGFIQILVGFSVGFIKLLKQGKPLQAVAGKLSWVIFWPSLILFVGASFLKSIEGLKSVFLVFIVLAAFLVLFASGAPSRNWLTRIAKGLFNLYQGIMGTVGDIISYSRLMALGLVTVGLAMAINILVDVMSQIPLLKYILVPLIFVGGHLFSVGINVLGAYVHTLRLQYAEFFTKFFDGGGEPFRPLKKETKFVMVAESTE